MAPTTRTRSGKLAPARELLGDVVTKEGAGKRKNAKTGAGVKKAAAGKEVVSQKGTATKRVTKKEVTKKEVTKKEVTKKEVTKKEVIKKKGAEKAVAKTPVAENKTAKKVVMTVTSKKPAKKAAVVQKKAEEKPNESAEKKQKSSRPPKDPSSPIKEGCLILEPNLALVASNEEIICSPLLPYETTTTPAKTALGGTTFGSAIVDRSGFVFRRETRHSSEDSSIDDWGHTRVWAPTPEVGQRAFWKVPFDGRKYCIELDRKTEPAKTKKRGRSAEKDPLGGVTYKVDSPFPKILPDGRPLKFVMWDPETDDQEQEGEVWPSGFKVPPSVWEENVVSFKQGSHPRKTKNQQGNTENTKWGWCGTGCKYRHATCEGCGRMSPCEANKIFPRDYVGPNVEKENSESRNGCIDGGIWCGWRLPNPISPATEPPSSGTLLADDESVPRIAGLESGTRKRKAKEEGKGKGKGSPKRGKPKGLGITGDTIAALLGKIDWCSTSKKSAKDSGVGVAGFLSEEFKNLRSDIIGQLGKKTGKSSGDSKGK